MYFIKTICAVWFVVKAVFGKNVLQNLKQNEFFAALILIGLTAGGFLRV
jgi:hypothetical protein